MRELEQSPANYDILYAARADRKLFRCDNVNGSNPVWTDLTQFLPDNILINDLEAHPTDENIVYMAMGSRAYKSSDKGKSWTDITGSLPTVSLNSLAYYKISHEGLYAGTDLGIFYRDNFLDDWILYSDGFPFSGRVTEVEIFHDPANPENDVIRAGTYGRGLWESDMFYDTPVADFTADQTLIPPFCELNFTDLSAGVPTGWNWTFEGANPSNSNQKNPTGITYAEPGTFKVTLVVTNKAGTSEMVKEDYITVSDQLMPVPDFSVDNTTACSNSVIHFNNLSQYCPTSFVWSFSPDNVIYLNGTNWNSPEPVVRFTESGQYSVSLTVQNSNGTATVNRENYILVGGYTMPFYESFEEGFTRGWTLENPDLRKTWQIIEPDYTPSGLNAAFMNHFDYYFMFERDRLISPPLNLSGVTEALLNFKHAYAQRFSQVDSLLVKISTDCGNTWQTIYANGPDGNGGFETSLPTSLYFNPATEDDWCGGGYGADCISLNISQYCNMPDVKIMFEAFNRIGNNLYIDDVSVEVLTSINEKSSRPESFNIYPNPAKDEINVRFFTAESELDISIYSISGTEMIAEKVKNIKSGESVILKTDKLAPGAYFVKVKGITISDSKLLIIK
jgi:PKD repeat protein